MGFFRWRQAGNKTFTKLTKCCNHLALALPVGKSSGATYTDIPNAGCIDPYGGLNRWDSSILRCTNLLLFGSARQRDRSKFHR